MTTAWIAEISTKTGTKYLSTKTNGYYANRPHFFSTASHFKRALTRLQQFGMHGDFSEVDSAHITVVRIENLERGLRDSTGARMTADAFMAAEKLKEAAKSFKPKDPQLTMYAIEYSPEARRSMRYPKQYAGAGKFGTRWKRSADVRNHLSANLDLLNGAYKDASIVILEYFAGDLLVPEKVSRLPLLKWYISTKAGAKRWADVSETFTDWDKVSDTLGDRPIPYGVK
jgi:hypothetical protein